MGGSGSGRWGWSTRKTTVEQCRSISLQYLHREGLLEPGQSSALSWSDRLTGERKASIGLCTFAESVEVHYTLRPGDEDEERIRYRVPLTSTPCNWGGERPWFTCPGAGCGRRVGKLYLPPRPEKYFLCRHCHELSYRSRQTYDKRFAALRRNSALLEPLLRKAEYGGLSCREMLLLMRVSAMW